MVEAIEPGHRPAGQSLESVDYGENSNNNKPDTKDVRQDPRPYHDDQSSDYSDDTSDESAYLN